MCIETIVVICIVFAILYALIRFIVPEPFKQWAYWIMLAAAGLWVITHIHGLLHLSISC